MIILPILFFVTAILYSSVGFGGGSTYLALLLDMGHTILYFASYSLGMQYCRRLWKFFQLH